VSPILCVSHGNSSKGRNRSASPTGNQRPFFEMFVPSTPKVLLPRPADFISWSDSRCIDCWGEGGTWK
jgi:hypothetical protein